MLNATRHGRNWNLQQVNHLRKAFYKSYVKWEDLNQTQRSKAIIFWVTNLTDGVRFALKQCFEADAANESTEEANSGNCMTSSSVNESNGGEDAERDEDSKKSRGLKQGSANVLPRNLRKHKD